MLYSPERSSLAGTAPTGSVLHETIVSAGVHSGKRHTLFGVKDGNASSMGRGYRSIGKLSAFLLRALPLLPMCCIVVFGSAPAHAQSAKAWAKRGDVAESHQDFDAGYEAYQHATTLKPNDLRYKTNFARLRYQAAVSHVDRGRVVRESGDLNGALAQFQRAIQIDPSNQAAKQEIDQVQRLLSTQPTGPAPPTEQMSRQN
ncbi:MAG TPA: type II and III secretion system protein, partial [Acidobacteriaceae bacterium]